MRYLITGGAGFIGSHLAEHLVAAGHDVTVLDDLSSGRRTNLASVRRRIRFLRGSVTDANMCRRAMEGIECVLHHAAVTSVQQSVDDPLSAHQVNATGTLNVLLTARAAGVRRVVYAGSTSAYGNPATLPNTEDHVTRPLSPYAASKLGGEDYCIALHATYGLETVVLRYFNIFGPRQDPNSQYAAVVPRFIAVRYWQKQLRGPIGTVAIAPHMRATRGTELPVLRADVRHLVAGHGPTPHLDLLLDDRHGPHPETHLTDP